jgi:hypothetical protein
MSKIFELFGYPLDAWTSEAQQNCQRANCPFTDCECDGGGNRYLSGINLITRKDLQKFFPGKNTVQTGVCSLRPAPDEQPWIVCPRRLLALKNGLSNYQKLTIKRLLDVSGVPKKTPLSVWSEVKMKVSTQNEEEEAKSFDYTFDYVLAGAHRKTVSEIAKLLGETEAFIRKKAQENAFTLAQRGGQTWVDDFPADPVIIVEVMTSSTSGGNKEKRTQIAMAFEDAVKNGNKHEGPGINYRQVWARMVSQLIVKSQVGIAWGGKTIWVLQDVLANYISQTTALNLEKYLSEHPDEVNILAFGYGKNANVNSRREKVIALSDSKFYSGPISNATTNATGFLDIVKIGAPPPKKYLWRSLFLKKSCAQINGNLAHAKQTVGKTMSPQPVTAQSKAETLNHLTGENL